MAGKENGEKIQYKKIYQGCMLGAKKAITTVIDAVYPPVCPICCEPIAGIGKKGDACDKCREKLVYIKEPRCLKCGKEIKDADVQYCHDCAKREMSQHPHLFEQGTAVFEYTDAIQNSIYRFKYQNKREYALFYAKEIEKICAEQIKLWKPDLIIPVPLHCSKYRRRGYNQAELIAEKLAAILKIPLGENVLVRLKKTIPMKELNNQERTKNLENAFICTDISVEYKRILIVDDIYTTGATIDACAKVLKNAGAREVYYVCLCIGKGF